ncbi:helix-turn-helix domain-containing protein [Streptomyces sp. NPDC051572]|uniref:TetR/AcrR family transcriptional regulator n=1 Tax=unclassified Streptomyces TaxID=2593676 RepID=UPI00344DB832
MQDTALELFAEKGYERTSLREISERLEVTKAALYYHFKTKEDIVVSLFTDLMAPIDALIAWSKEQPPTLETKHEILARYSLALADAAPLFRLMQENRATMRELSIGKNFEDHMTALLDQLVPDDAALTDRVRGFSALLLGRVGAFALADVEGSPEEKRKAVLEVATGLVAQAHRSV